MKVNHLALAGVLALCAILFQGLPGSASPDDHEVNVSFDTPPLGKRITVHLRKDVLGMAANYAMSPVIDKLSGVELSITGDLEALNKDWVVLKLNTGNYWIARDNVLLIASDQ